MSSSRLNIVLVGNPNSGKTSLFNALTGLNQQVGNFPGVTVDKKTGILSIGNGESVEITDLPGSYSLYPRRADEWVSYKVLMNSDKEVKPDIILLVADASNLKRNLLFCSQIIDLKIPVVVALTMNDIAEKNGITIDIAGLSTELGVPIIPVNPRKNKGVGELKKTIATFYKNKFKRPSRDFIPYAHLADKPVEEVKKLFPAICDYLALHYLINHSNLSFTAEEHKRLKDIAFETGFLPTKVQAEEIMMRYQRINQILKQFVVSPDPLQKKLASEKIDNVLLSKHFGYIYLLGVLFILFQSVFWLAQFPMDGIDWGFKTMAGYFNSVLPNTWWANLFVNGILAGVGGIFVFIPQIMILFGLITILEDTGYMARISFLTDLLMRKVGLNGKSVMPMISAYACAVPAVMATRNIENRKERLLTILITPLMSCSARLPVYTMLIAVSVENRYYWGIISLQGLVMMGLYLFGTLMALVVSFVAKWFIKINDKSYFILELPTYKSPRWKNVFITMIEKAKIFIMGAGKVIMLISILLWVLGTFGPPTNMEKLEEGHDGWVKESKTPEALKETEKRYASERLKGSYAGMLGKAIEPVIQPLGFDWKIGIALITSFAAREVFVSTMATLYAVEDGDNTSLRNRLQNAVRQDGKKVFTLATALSLMVFYVLAMQCMSTLAIVKRETGSWKWPAIQFVYMTLLAYSMSFVTYQIFS